MIDLHVHSNRSDGRLSPVACVAEAAARGLAAIALVDHDVLDGLEEARAAGVEHGVEVVTGVELTASGPGDRAVHVLGYLFDPADQELLAALGCARTLMAAHVDEVLEAVREAGGRLHSSHLDRYRHRYAGGAALVFGMLEQGVLAGAPAGTGMRLLRLAAREPRAYAVAEAVEIIHGAGGIASLAHPSRLVRGRPLLDVDDLWPYVDLGMDALEAWQWIPGGWGSAHYQRVAGRLGLLVTGGSDDHGKRTADGRMRLGEQRVPDLVLEALKARQAVGRRPGP